MLGYLLSRGSIQCLACLLNPEDNMNTAYFSAFAALAGSVIGGLTTFAAAWVTQRQQANVQWFLQEKTRRQELYQQFIEEASKIYVDALMHDQAAIPPLVSLYASINKMRDVSTSAVAERAEKLVRRSSIPILTEQDLARAARDDGERRAGLLAGIQRGLRRRTRCADAWRVSPPVDGYLWRIPSDGPQS